MIFVSQFPTRYKQWLYFQNRKFYQGTWECSQKWTVLHLSGQLRIRWDVGEETLLAIHWSSSRAMLALKKKTYQVQVTSHKSDAGTLYVVSAGSTPDNIIWISSSLGYKYFIDLPMSQKILVWWKGNTWVLMSDCIHISAAPLTSWIVLGCIF